MNYEPVRLDGRRYLHNTVGLELVRACPSTKPNIKIREGRMEMQLSQYQCHKKVRAAKIGAIEHTGEAGCWRLDLLTPIDAHDERLVAISVDVDQAWIERFNPVIGGYYVVYEDGYASFSPAKAFEEGYTMIVMTPPANPA